MPKDAIEELGYDSLIEGMTQRNAKVKNFFRSRSSSGVKFEQQIDKLIQLVMDSISETDLPENFTTQVGGESISTVKITQPLFDKVVTSPIWRKAIDNFNANRLLKQYFLPEVQQKVDVSGQKGSGIISLKPNANTNLVKIYNLLTKCNFQAKNYSSADWVKQKAKDLNWDLSKLNFGNSRFRFYASILSGLGNKQQDIENSYFWAIDNYIKYSMIKTIIWHFKVVYELTGFGAIDLQGNSLNTVNYIIFNDPATDFITVKSVQRIIKDVLNNPTLVPDNPWETGVSIDKKLFGY